MKVSGQDGTYLQSYKFSGRRYDAGDKERICGEKSGGIYRR